MIRPDLASTFLVNEAKGHVAAYDAIHLWDTTAATPGKPAAFVGFTNNMIPARPANPVNPLDVQAADAWNDFYNGWFPNAVIDGWVDANFDGIKTADEVHADFMDKADFLGVQYYGSQPMQGFGVAPDPRLPIPARASGAVHAVADVQRLQPAHRPRWLPRGARGRGVLRKAVVDHRERHRRRRGLEAAVLHRQPHRGGAGHGRARHGHPRLHVLVVRRQPRVGRGL